MLRARCLTVATLVIMATTTACGSAGQPAPYDATGIDGLEIPTPSPDPGDFQRRVDNPWLALEVSPEREYVVSEGGDPVGRLELDVTSTNVAVAGLRATAVRTVTRIRGARNETVTSYYAQDRDGNVWLVGEDTADGEWRVGEGTPAGLAMPADPRIGDGWTLAERPTRTLRVDADPETPGDDSVTLEEIETGVRSAYIKGVGLIRLAEGTRELELLD